MHTGLNAANIGQTCSSEWPSEYLRDPLGRDDDFILGIGQQQPEAKKDRVQSKTILLAEDDDDLRDIMEVYLDMMGYGVVPCCDGQVASAMFRSKMSMDALITDLEMPGKSGMELARELTQIRPSFPVLIISGALISSDMGLEIENRNWKFMAKPCELPSVLATLQSLLYPRTRQAA